MNTKPLTGKHIADCAERNGARVVYNPAVKYGDVGTYTVSGSSGKAAMFTEGPVAPRTGFLLGRVIAWVLAMFAAVVIIGALISTTNGPLGIMLANVLESTPFPTPMPMGW